jgi:hypothetical protein
LVAVEVETVRLDAAATAEEVEAVEAALRDEGLEAPVRADWTKPPQTGNGVFTMVLIVLGVSFYKFLSAYATTLGEEAGKATAERVRNLARRLHGARGESPASKVGWVEFDDPEGTKLMLSPDVPDEAYRQLEQLDWEKFRGGMVMWDPERGRWFDPNRSD